jgi:cytoskeletal protein RodZ
MSDFGGKLRLARERRGISLRQIADSTKISIAALEALERNDVSKLPGGIFSRAFVRSYAVEVGLDPDETVREFLERFQSDPVAAAAPAVIPDEESNFESQQRMAGVVLKLLVISIPLIVVLLYFTLRTRPAAHVAALSEPPATAPPPAAAAAAPSLPAPAARAATTAGGTQPAKSMTLELHPTGECWIKLTVDGRPVLSRLMLAGEREVREVRSTVIIEVGNAGAFAFSINGRPGKPLGQSGQVRTARITVDTLAQYVQ